MLIVRVEIHSEYTSDFIIDVDRHLSEGNDKPLRVATTSSSDMVVRIWR